MTRILLVSPRRGADFADQKDLPSLGDGVDFPRALMPPLDLATLKALTPPGIDVDIWDESLREPITEDTVFEHDYDLIGATAYNLHIPWALELAKTVRRKGIPVIIGGPGVSGSPEKCRGAFDVVFIGEAERTWPQFLKDFQDGRYHREYRQVERPDVSDSPKPQWDGVENMSRDYLLGAVQTTRGCPFDCSFCDVIHLFGRQPRHKAIETVVAEVAELQRRGMRMIFFCDDNFIGRPQYAKDLLRELIALNKTFERPIGFTTQATINIADDDEMMRLLADANFHWVLIGIESPREACLREANKPQNYRTNLVEATRKIQSYGVLVKGAMIVGFDHDDVEIFDEVYSFLRKCQILNCGVSMLHAYPGTPLLSRLQREGRVVALSDGELWRHTRPTTNIIPSQMTRVQLFEGYKRLLERIRDWEYFGACAKELVDGIERKPEVPQGGPPDPTRIELVRRAIESLDEEPRRIVKEVLQYTFLTAPYMMEKIVSAVFRFGGSVLGLPSLSTEMQEQIDREAAPGYAPTVVNTIPSIPEGFRKPYQWEVFPKTYEWLQEGLADERFLAAALIEVWKDFLVRWGETFKAFEDYHEVYLRELCDRAIELGNEGALGGAVVNGGVGLRGGVELRRLAGEILVSVEQDMRGVGESEDAGVVQLRVPEAGA